MNHRRLRRVLALPTLACIALASSLCLHAYNTVGHTWGTSRVNYFVNPASRWVSPSAAVSAVQTAASVWQQANANIELVYAGTTGGASLALNGRNEVFFRDGGGAVGETWYWWDGTGRLVDFDIVLNEAYQFFAGSGCSNGIYIENVAAHEFGHALGLAHSEHYGVTMQPAMQSYCDTTQVSLEADDIAGIRALYPGGAAVAPAPSNTAPSVSIHSPSSGTSLLEGLVVVLAASATDAQDGDISHRLVWSSNLLGYLGAGGSVALAMTPGTHTITASVQDSGGMSAAHQISITGISNIFSPPPATEPGPAPPPATEPAPVPPAASAPAPSGATLYAQGYKVRGRQKVNLSWTGLADGVDIYRDGQWLTAVGGNQWTDNVDERGGDSYTYQVCAAGICASATVQF